MVRQARNSFKVSPDFDYVFVVCDGDSPNFTKAVEDSSARLRKADGNKVSIEVIATHPSFESWLLLHFEYTTATMDADGAITNLKAHLPDYQKNDRNISTRYRPDSIKHAKTECVAMRSLPRPELTHQSQICRRSSRRSRN
jgi:hypothetical protein